MPRVNGVFSLLSGSKGAPNTTIQSAPYNSQLDDFAQDLNLARPITAGGTGATTASGARENLGLLLGTNIQAYDAGLQSIAGLTTAADQTIYATGPDAYATTALTPYGRSILALADVAALKTSLALGALASKGSINDADWSGADLSIANGGTGASTAAAARDALGLGNVNNTSDADKPVSSAQQTALNQKANSNDLSALAGRTITGAGLATGGGDLSANRIITVPKSTSAQALAGTDDATAMTPARVKDAIDANVPPGLGIGQTWQNMLPSRGAGTVYQNTSGKPIIVAPGGWARSGFCEGQVSADNSNWITPPRPEKVVSSDTLYYYAYPMFVVPPGQYYRLTVGNNFLGTIAWLELR